MAWLNQNFEKLVSAVLLGLIVLLIFANVIMRYIFNQSLSWGEELTLWLFVWFIWLAVSYGFHKREHIRISILRDRLGNRSQLRLDLFVNLLIIAFFAVIVFECLSLISQNFVLSQKSVVLKLPIPILYFSAPFGAALASFRLLQHSKEILATLRSLPKETSS